MTLLKKIYTVTKNHHITFSLNVPIEETMCFDAVYEPELQCLDKEFKSDFVQLGVVVWMYVDGELAGECYGVPLPFLDEDVEEFNPDEPETIYCYSTTILPKFQGRGLGYALVAYWHKECVEQGFTKIIGHATSPAMVKVRSNFRANFTKTIENWFGTQRTAHYYEMALK